MRDAGVSLRIKYRLEEVPTDAQAAEWAELTERLIQNGAEPEDAGSEAADRLFTINPNLILKSEADTIEALLERARAK